MRIRVLSDLHLEFADFAPPRCDADVVVLAGDIHVGVKGVAWAARAFQSTPVLYVPGNHEFYGQAWPRLVDKLRAAAEGTSVEVLDNSAVSIGGVRFLGCTFWTDFELLGDPRIAGHYATGQMTDYRRIRVSPAYRKLRSLDTAVLNRRSQAWMRQELAASDGKGAAVVITHHAPSARSLPSGYANDLLSAAYASNLDDLVEQSGAALWIHGHLHRSSDFRVGPTRVLCNPRGYPGEAVAGFRNDLVVSIDGTP